MNVVDIPITNDSLVEMVEQFYGNLQKIPSSPVLLEREQATVNITDNDSKFDLIGPRLNQDSI